MKVCPRCNQTYTDDGLNFCLADGELLMAPQSNEAPTQLFNDPSPPTLFMDSPRATNPNHSPWQEQPSQPMAPWQNQPQGMQNPGFGVPAFAPASRDQTLPVIGMVLGVLSMLMICCYGGIWLGIPAAIVGFLGMRNADSDPSRYTGRGLAIAGMVLGIVSFLCAMGFIIIGILGSIT
jgi:Domain of unknown function (DUF4190)